MSQHYDNEPGTVVKGNYTDTEEHYTVIDGYYTEVGPPDPDTPYEELKT